MDRCQEWTSMEEGKAVVGLVLSRPDSTLKSDSESVARWRRFSLLFRDNSAVHIFSDVVFLNDTRVDQRQN